MVFRIGAQLWMDFCGKEVAGICWSRSGLTCPDYFVPLETDDADILRCFVFPQFRGRGIYQTMLKHFASNWEITMEFAGFLLAANLGTTPRFGGLRKPDFTLLDGWFA